MRCPVDCTFVLVLETVQGSALEKCTHSESGRLSFSAKHSPQAVEVNGTENTPTWYYHKSFSLAKQRTWSGRAMDSNVHRRVQTSSHCRKRCKELGCHHHFGLRFAHALFWHRIQAPVSGFHALAEIQERAQSLGDGDFAVGTEFRVLESRVTFAPPVTM
jgi:hypothetical protein